MIKEFKDFINKGDVLDMAVGVIIGAAIGKIVASLVNDIIMPIIGALLGGIDFTTLSIKIGDATILYGAFIQTIIDFLIIAIFVFLFVKLITKALNRKKPDLVKIEKEEVKLLKEIRNLLKK